MQALKKSIEMIAKQLGALQPTAKLLIGSLMVILVMALFLVGQYAGKAPMSPLPVPAEVHAEVVSHLDAAGIPYEEAGGQLLVPTEKKYAILARLGENAVISGNDINFNALIELTSPFQGREQTRAMWSIAKMNALERMISEMQGVAGAKVILAETRGTPGIGSSRIPPSAAVSVRMTSEPMTQKLADSIARLVAGAEAGLKVENVAVTDVSFNKTFRARGADTYSTGDYLELKDSTERHFRAIIEEALKYIPGVIITVNAVVDVRQEESRHTTFEEPKVGPLESRTEEVSSRNASAANEPAVLPNTGANIASSGGRDSESTKSVNEERSRPVFPGGQRVVTDPKGHPIQINATIGVPRSFFVKVFQVEQGDPQADPDATALAPIIQTVAGDIKMQVDPLISTDALQGAVAGTVLVSMIHDFNMPAGQFGGLGTDGGGLGAMLVGDGLLKNVGLGALALVSLVMMFLMVRKAGAREELPTPEELVGVPPALEARLSDVVGEVEESEPALEGMELDDHSLRTQQLVDQINDMVQSGPEDAASLLHRWIKNED